MLFFVHAGRDTAAVVPDADGIVFQDRHLDIGAVAGHRFVDTVVDDLIDQMVQTALTDVADIHRRTLADGLKAFQNLDTVGGILFFRFFHLFVFNHICMLISFIFKHLSAKRQTRAHKHTNIALFCVFCKGFATQKSAYRESFPPLRA